MLILAGQTAKARKQLCELRLEMGSRLGLRDPQKFSCLWVIDFPLFEWDDETQRYYAMHHPFTSPNPDDLHLLDSDTGAVRATAYDMVVNGNELGGGSIRIHEAELQDHMFRLLGLSEEDAQYKFGFLMNAFKYGAHLMADWHSDLTASCRSSPDSTPYATSSHSPKTTPAAT